MPDSLTWQITPITLELKFTWRISRNQADSKNNFVVSVSDGRFTGRGEVAPNVRYNETPELIKSQFEALYPNLQLQLISPTAELALPSSPKEVCNALRFGITSAYIHYQSAKSGKPVPALLGLPLVKSAVTCFSIPLMEPGLLQQFITENNLARFSLLKVKVARHFAADTINEVARITGKPLLIDGNEAWTDPDDVLRELEKISAPEIKFIEQPLPAALTNEYEYLKKHCTIDLFADESVTDKADFSELVKQFNGINVKLMKAGSYQNSVALLQEAKKHRLKTMIGCMIESSLGIWSAMQISSLADFCDLDGFLMLKNDPFRMISEQNGVLEMTDQITSGS